MNLKSFILLLAIVLITGTIKAAENRPKSFYGAETSEVLIEESISSEQLQQMLQAYLLTDQYDRGRLYNGDRAALYDMNVYLDLANDLYQIEEGKLEQTSNCRIENFKFNGNFGDLKNKDLQNLAITCDWIFVDEKTKEEKNIKITLRNGGASSYGFLPDFTKGGPLALWSSNSVSYKKFKASNGQKLTIKIKYWSSFVKEKKSFLYSIILKDGDKKLSCKSSIK